MSDVDWDPTTGLVASSSGRRFTSATMLTIAASAYLVLFAVMWIPRYAGYEGWAFMYPVFVVLWLPVELAVVAAIVLGIVDAVSDDRGRQRRGWLVLAGGVALLILSLPLLWFGDLLRIPFSGQ